MSAGGGKQLISVHPDELKFLCTLSLSLFPSHCPYTYMHAALGNQKGL